MISKGDKNKARLKRHYRIRKVVKGTPDRPRLSVYRSGKNTYAQIIDDTKAITIVAASTKEKALATLKNGGNIEAAKEVGKLIATKAVEKGINKVVFDRGGYLYHGRIQALADAAREAGLEF